MRCEEEKESKTTLELYSRCKKKIGEEQIYENDFNSVLLYRCRSNTLKLKWRNRFAGGDEICDLCGGSEVETLEHFLLDCVSLSMRCGGGGGYRGSQWRRCCCLRWWRGRALVTWEAILVSSGGGGSSWWVEWRWRQSRKWGANNGTSAEEIRRTSAKEKATLEIISIYLYIWLIL